jgi:putative peptidoglycan lipid II flippase
MALVMPVSAILNCLSADEIARGRSQVTNLRASILNISVLVGIGIVVLTGWINALAWAFAVAFNILGAVSLWIFFFS